MAGQVVSSYCWLSLICSFLVVLLCFPSFRIDLFSFALGDFQCFRLLWAVLLRSRYFFGSCHKCSRLFFVVRFVSGGFNVVLNCSKLRFNMFKVV